MVVGVTGKYCAGKNVVSEVLAEAGFQVIDVDRLGHRALQENRDAVVKRFGAPIVAPDGSIDRRELGRIVFASADALQSLEEIIHPTMVRHVQEEIAQGNARGFIVNAAILFRMGLHAHCDRVLWVQAPLPLRILRALRRDNLSPLQIVRRMWSQRKLSPQPFRNLVDIYSVRNSGSRKGLKKEVLRLVASGREA